MSTIPTASSSTPRSRTADECGEFLASCAPWVREPLADWLEHRWGPSDAREYAYDVFGDRRAASDASPGACARRRGDDARPRRRRRSCTSTSTRSTRRSSSSTIRRSSGKPVIVGGLGPRGVVAAASYEARALRRVLGDADGAGAPRVPRRRVPRAAVRRATATRAARSWRSSRSFTPLVEPIALDEAFLDVAGARRLHGTGPEIAVAIRARVQRRDRAHRVGRRRDHEAARQAGQRPRQARRPARRRAGHRARRSSTRSASSASGASGRRPSAGSPSSASRTVGDLAALPEDDARRARSARAGHHLHALAWNRDERAGRAEQVAKSIGHEETFPVDLHDRAALEHELCGWPTAWRRACGPRRVAGRTVQLKVRFGDFRTITRSRTLRRAHRPRRRHRRGRARELLRRVPTSTPASACSACRCSSSVRRDAVAPATASSTSRARPPSGPAPADAGPDALDPVRSARRAALERSVDAVRARFGPVRSGTVRRIACPWCRSEASRPILQCSLGPVR